MNCLHFSASFAWTFSKPTPNDEVEANFLKKRMLRFPPSRTHHAPVGAGATLNSRAVCLRRLFHLPSRALTAVLPIISFTCVDTFCQIHISTSNRIRPSVIECIFRFLRTHARCLGMVDVKNFISYNITEINSICVLWLLLLCGLI